MKKFFQITPLILAALVAAGLLSTLRHKPEGALHVRDFGKY